MAKEQVTNDTPSASQLLRALLLIAIAEREEQPGAGGTPKRTEVILSDAGFSLSEIAALTGRPYESVKSTIRRSRERQ